jgi:radical SAM superfamily enzyme YgiQ (UPF0313 family)
MADITLINYYKDRSLVRRVPLGCLSLLGSLNDKGYDARFVDFQNLASDFDLENFITNPARVSNHIAISCYSMMLPWLLPSLKKFKARYPHKKTILGGTGPSSNSHGILNKCDFIDFIIEGEGETALPMLIDHIENPQNAVSSIPNLVFRDGNRIIRNKRRREVITHHKPTDYSLLGKNEYDDPSCIVTVRGCPYDCGFCYNKHMWGCSVQQRTMQQVFTDIDSIISYFKINYISIADDLFFTYKKRYSEFFKIYHNRHYSFEYQVMGARIDSIDEDVLKHLSRSNCISIWYGIESASDRILQRINKKIRISDAVDALKTTKKYIPEVVASFIVGFPFETADEFNETLRLASRLNDAGIHVIVNFLRPQNETAIYNAYKHRLTYVDHPFIISPARIDNKARQAIINDPDVYCWYYTYDTPKIDYKIERYTKFRDMLNSHDTPF